MEIDFTEKKNRFLYFLYLDKGLCLRRRSQKSTRKGECPVSLCHLVGRDNRNVGRPGDTDWDHDMGER